MLIGFGAPVSGAWATPANLARFAAGAEEAGYASLWTFQRLLIPDGAAATMEPVYHSVLDPMTTLGYAAAVTSRIRLAVAVINTYVPPAYLAKQAATVDVLSEGRLDLGLGIGWMPEEFALMSTDMAARGARTAEYVEVLRALWAGPAEFSGRFYQVPRGEMAPRPVQAGGPPILLGGMAKPALERVGRIADGWVTSSRTDLSRVGELIGVVRDAAAQAGRDPDALRVICRGVVRAGAPETGPDGQRLLLSGEFGQIREDADSLAAQGVTEIFYDLNWDRQVGAPDADPAAATARAAEIMAALAPGA
jgi:probable F420-dependent oxidoreductase